MNVQDMMIVTVDRAALQRHFNRKGVDPIETMLNLHTMDQWRGWWVREYLEEEIENGRKA